MNGRFSFAALLLLFVFVLGCAGERGPLWADPGLVRLAPDHRQVAVEIHNVSGTIRPVGGFELVGEDWGSLRFLDDSLPRTIPANDSVVVRLEASSASFRSGPNQYRSGKASLRFRSNQHELEVPIEFVGTEARGSGVPPLGFSIVALALLGVGVLGVRRSAGTSDATLKQRLVIAGALASMLLLAATIPLGNALCLGRAGVPVGAAELEQCRAGLGGYALTILPADPGVWWWIVAPALLAIATGSIRARVNPAEIGLAVMRTLGLAIVLASFATAVAPTSAAATDHVLAQIRSTPMFGFELPAWGIVALPIGWVAMMALASPARTEQDPLLAKLARFERLLWSALIATLFFGGWSIPGLSDRAVPLLNHAGTLACELAMFALKVTLIDLGLARLGKHVDQTPAALLRIHGRWTLPILLVNLIAVALWRAT